MTSFTAALAYRTDPFMGHDRYAGALIQIKRVAKIRASAQKALVDLDQWGPIEITAKGTIPLEAKRSNGSAA
jgi:hypothetical protein